MKAGDQDPKTLRAVARILVRLVGEHQVTMRDGDDYLVRRDPFIDMAYFLAARSRRNEARKAGPSPKPRTKRKHANYR